MWRQARWNEPLIYELGHEGRRGHIVPREEGIRGKPLLPGNLERRSIPLPQLSEVEVARHFLRLSEMSYGVDNGPVPLGSCTMKYNPKISEHLSHDPRITGLHPLQDDDTVQGLLEILYSLERWLAEITGMDRCSLQPPAGAAGELTGTLMIRKYHLDYGEERDEMLVPDSAHGTNPASATMAGFTVVKIPSNSDGEVDVDALKSSLGPRTAGMMLTNPNTLGVFESRISEIASLVHDAGGLLYYDGANLNGILGITRPGDMGFDIVHINIHKTFSTPHGGGGPGAGPLCAKGELVDYLSRPLISRKNGKYYWDYGCGKCIGRMHAFKGNIIPLIKAFIYIAGLGPQGLRRVAEISTLNTNYFIALMRNVDGYILPYNPSKPRKHEVVLSAKPLVQEKHVTAEDVAKNLLDRGLYAPTIYFPLIVEEALMVEFTESETKENIDLYAKALREIAEMPAEEARKAPRNTATRRLDMVKANHPRYVTPSYRVYRKRAAGEITRL